MSKLESETKDTEKKMRGSMDLLLSAGKGHRGHVKQVRGLVSTEHTKGGHYLRSQTTKDNSQREAFRGFPPWVKNKSEREGWECSSAG